MGLSMILYALQFLAGLYFAVEAIIAWTITSAVVFIVVWLSFDIMRVLFVPLVEVAPKNKIENRPLSNNEQRWGRK
jgi:hypothetical protein